MTTFSRSVRILALPALFALVLSPGTPATAATATAATAAPAPAMVTVVHGVRGLVADVRVDGKLVLSGFAPQRVTDPLALAAGSHRVQIWKSGAPASSKPALDTTVPVTAGLHATLAVGLTSEGTPQITTYNDNLGPAAAGGTGLALRNIAATPPVRVTVDAKVVANGLRAPQQEITAVAAGTHTVAVLPVSGESPLFPPQSVPTVAGRAMALYLIGSTKDNSLGWVAQTIRPSVTPSAVQTGVGPMDQPRSGVGRLGWLTLAVLGSVGLVSWSARMRRRRAAGLHP